MIRKSRNRFSEKIMLKQEPPEAPDMNEQIAALQDDMIAWRHDLHAHPELGFEEHRTSDFVAARLAEFGVEVHRGLAGTGVVVFLRAATATRTNTLSLHDAVLI